MTPDWHFKAALESNPQAVNPEALGHTRRWAVGRWMQVSWPELWRGFRRVFEGSLKTHEEAGP